MKLREKIDLPNGGDRVALMSAVMDALKDLHPDLVAEVGDVFFDRQGFWFKMTFNVRGAPPNELREVAQREHLRIMERVGQFSLVDYDSKRKKPYILKRKDGTLVEAGQEFVQKVFSKKVHHVEALRNSEKIF